ncbi:sensor histidine kinase [Pleurocapsales cyanobacterium LEGE 10410]|nr:sensor histidine kinase [Pleurocapsales cyanobacterium LEGE 10410]
MSKDLGRILLAKTKTIAQSWIEAIREDVDIESSKQLEYESVRNSIPLVIEALATLLSQSINNQQQKLENYSFEHGVVRAEQDYDVAEMVREYGLLRKVIFTVLKSDLIASSPDEILQSIELIDSVIDRVISLSLESYLATRLEELERVRGQLLLTNQELTRLVESQREDVSYLAHELKSPLNSIMGFSNLLLQQQQKLTRDSETSLSLQCTEKVITNSKQLLRLINDVLEISRYEAGKMPLNLEPTDVRSLITLVVEALEPSAEQKNLELIVDCDRAPEQVLSDPLKLRQIITNLTSNAIRYTESGLVKITCLMTDDRQWYIAFSDTGIGIAPELKAQIFKPYYRAGAVDDYSPDSTGLGLAIVERLVKLLQGEISLVSEPAEGSIFTVTFPLEITNVA